MLTTRGIEAIISSTTLMNCVQYSSPRLNLHSPHHSNPDTNQSITESPSMSSPKVTELHLKLRKLESSLQSVKESLTTFSVFIRTHTPTSTPCHSVSGPRTPSVSSSETYQDDTESPRIALTYISAIRNSLKYRFEAIHQDLETTSICVDKLKAKLIRKLRCGSPDGGGEWGYIGEWIEEIGDLYKVIDGKFNETC